MFQQRNVDYRLDGWPAKRSWLVIRYFEWQNRFFYRRLHLNAKYYSNGTGFLHPFALSQRLLFLSLIGLSCSLYLLPLTLSLFLSLSLLGHVSFSTYLRLLSSSFFHLVSSTRFDILYLTFLLFLVGGTVRTQLRRPWDKRLHFLIFKCAQTSYPAIVCPTEALRRGFRADKPVPPSMHAANAAASYYRVPLCSHLLSLLSSFSRLLSLPLYVSFLVSLRSSLTATKARSSRWKMQIATGESNGYEIVRDVALSFRTDPVITKSQGSFFFVPRNCIGRDGRSRFHAS